MVGTNAVAHGGAHLDTTQDTHAQEQTRLAIGGQLLERLGELEALLVAEVPEPSTDLAVALVDVRLAVDETVAEARRLATRVRVARAALTDDVDG
jgi:hypothetical protein